MEKNTNFITGFEFKGFPGICDLFFKSVHGQISQFICSLFYDHLENQMPG